MDNEPLFFKQPPRALAQHLPLLPVQTEEGNDYSTSIDNMQIMIAEVRDAVIKIERNQLKQADTLRKEIATLDKHLNKLLNYERDTEKRAKREEAKSKQLSDKMYNAFKANGKKDKVLSQLGKTATGVVSSLMQGLLDTIFPGLGRAGFTRGISNWAVGGIAGLLFGRTAMKLAPKLFSNFNKTSTKGLGKAFKVKNTGVFENLFGKTTAQKMAKNVSKATVMDATGKIVGETTYTGGRMGAKTTSKTTAKMGAKGLEGLLKSMGKMGGKGLGKGALKSIGKKIPGLGTVLGAIFAYQRLQEGDWLGAGLELVSGIASNFVGAGTVASLGLDAFLLGRDIKNGGGLGGENLLKGLKKGGIWSLLLGGAGGVIANLNETNYDKAMFGAMMGRYDELSGKSHGKTLFDILYGEKESGFVTTQTDVPVLKNVSPEAKAQAKLKTEQMLKLEELKFQYKQLEDKYNKGGTTTKAFKEQSDSLIQQMVNIRDLQKGKVKSPYKAGSNEALIWNYFANKGLSPEGIAGLMGNLKAESGLEFNRLQGDFDKNRTKSKAYTEGVNQGTTQFVKKNNIGYGLAQWTSAGRKKGLLELARRRGVSIDDPQLQLDYLWQELNAYKSGGKSLAQHLSEVKDIRSASNLILTKFERPADQGINAQNARFSRAIDTFNKFKDSVGTYIAQVEQSITSNTPKIEAVIMDINEFENALKTSDYQANKENALKSFGSDYDASSSAQAGVSQYVSQMDRTDVAGVYPTNNDLVQPTVITSQPEKSMGGLPDIKGVDVMSLLFHQLLLQQ